MTSINKKKIALIEKYNQEKLRKHAMEKGVILKSPETVFLSNDTKFGKNVVINPYVVIGRKTKIGNNVEILPFTHIENATLEANVNVGPFARIRPGSFLSNGSRVGNFVEVKKSKIGKNTKTDKAKNIRNHKKVSFGVDVGVRAPNIFGVMGQGTAKLIKNPQTVSRMGKRILLRYFKSLDNKSAKELLDDTDCIIEIKPKKYAVWEY